MPKQQFQDLKSILTSLSTPEKKTALSYISGFNSQTNSKSRNLNLINHLFKNPKSDYKTVFENIKPKYKSEAAFDKSIDRLKDKVIESLSLSINTNRKNNYSKLYKTKYQLIKELMGASIILGKGREQEALRIYDRVISKSKEFELYDQLIEALHIKQQLSSLISRNIDFTSFNKEMEHYIYCREARHKAMDWYHHFYSINDFKGNLNGKAKLLSKAISDMQHSYIKTGSNNVAYYLLRLLMEYYQVFKDYKRVASTALKLLNLTMQHQSIFMKGRIARVHGNIAENKIRLFQHHEGLKHIKQALPFMKKESFNYLCTKEYEFFCYFFLKDLLNSKSTIEAILNNKHINTLPFKKSKAYFLKANLEFILGNFKNSYKFLLETREIDKDTEGWNTWIKILSILNFIELSMIEQADFQIENFRRFIQRNFDNSEFRERDLVIMKILSKLESNDFDFKKVYEENTELISQLTTGKEELRWEIKSPELIIFDQWFMSKVHNTKYDPVYEPTTPFSSTPVDKIIPEMEFEKTG